MNPAHLRFLGQVALSGLVSLLVVSAYERYRPPPPAPIAVVDLKGMVEAFVQDEAKRGDPKDAAGLERKVAAFSAGLDAAARKVAGRTGLVLLTKQAVIAGAADVTDQFKAVVASEISEEANAGSGKK